MTRALSFASMLLVALAGSAAAEDAPGDAPAPAAPAKDEAKGEAKDEAKDETDTTAAPAKDEAAKDEATAVLESDEPSAEDVKDAPLPGQESGRLDPLPKDSLLRNVGQGVLTVPRAAVEIAMAPVRAGIYTYERFAVTDRFKRSFFDDTNTYGFYPTLNFDATYGLTLGARVVHRNLLGKRERFALRGGAGGEYRGLIDGTLRSGLRLGEYVSVELRGQFERRPEDRFFGIGNSDMAIETRHRQQLGRGTATVDVRTFDAFHVRVAGAATELEYAAATKGPRIDEIYDPNMLTGFTGGAANVYGELELRWDTRSHTNPFDQHAIFDGGSFLGVFAGRVHQLEMGRDYWRYGGEAQRFFPLWGARVIATRLHFESVTGDLNDVAFTQLPQLGGATVLRGYPSERFRDRVAALGSVEYFWDLNRYLMASVFVDAGRVYRSLQDIELDGMRMGYGASLQLHSKRSYIAGINVASSIDGGIFVNLAFDPVFEPEPRVEQK